MKDGELKVTKRCNLSRKDKTLKTDISPPGAEVISQAERCPVRVGNVLEVGGVESKNGLEHTAIGGAVCSPNVSRHSPLELVRWRHLRTSLPSSSVDVMAFVQCPIIPKATLGLPFCGITSEFQQALAAKKSVLGAVTTEKGPSFHVPMHRLGLVSGARLTSLSPQSGGASGVPLLASPTTAHEKE